MKLREFLPEAVLNELTRRGFLGGTLGAALGTGAGAAQAKSMSKTDQVKLSNTVLNTMIAKLRDSDMSSFTRFNQVLKMETMRALDQAGFDSTDNRNMMPIINNVEHHMRTRAQQTTGRQSSGDRLLQDIKAHYGRSGPRVAPPTAPASTATGSGRSSRTVNRPGDF